MLPWIFVGSYGAAGNEAALRAVGVTHVICASGSLQLRCGAGLGLASARRRPSLPLTISLSIYLPLPISRFPDAFEYLRLAVADVPSESISSVFPAALDFIDR